jgi:broad specificity phosphatase PhoE
VVLVASVRDLKQTLENPHMLVLSRRKITAVAVACSFLAILPAGTQAQVPGDDKALATALRAGGLVILVRHGATFADQADTDPLNFENISAQRNLNDNGKALARAFGEALRQAGVPVGKVYTSKFNRAYETATIAGFTDIEKTADLTEGGLVVTPNENNRRAEALRKRLAASPRPGTNTVLITHKPNILDALGKEWFDVKEGEASIFRPGNGSYVLVTRLQTTDWPRIAAAAK